MSPPVTIPPLGLHFVIAPTQETARAQGLSRGDHQISESASHPSLRLREDPASLNKVKDQARLLQVHLFPQFKSVCLPPPIFCN